MRTFLVVFALLIAPVLASAQAPEATLSDPTTLDAAVRADPELRLDVAFPAFGFAVASFEGAPVYVGGHVTVAHRSGHGVRVGAGAALDTGGSFLGSHPAHGDAWMLDVDYVYRLRLVGNDRMGLGLDLSGGVSGGEVRFHQATSGFCWSNCGAPPAVEEHVADGAHLGANVGASLDLRLTGFSFGIDLRYRPTFALEAQAGDELAQHLFTATAYLGFGFY